MGDKSPKDAHKKTGQKQAKASIEAEKKKAAMLRKQANDKER